MALLGMRRLPGLVADGRDQGEIFDTPHRFFFVASLHIRARRRVAQFKSLGEGEPDYQKILEEIIRRDEADQNRSVSPLHPHPQAKIICTDNFSADEVVGIILHQYFSN